MSAALKTLCSHRNCNNLAKNTRNQQEKTGAVSAKTCNSVKICDATGKIPYATAAKAWRVIKRMKDRSRSRKVYRCSPCDQWNIGAWQNKPAGLSLSKPAGLSLSKSDARRTAELAEVADRTSPQEARG